MSALFDYLYFRVQLLSLLLKKYILSDSYFNLLICIATDFNLYSK